MIPLYIRGLVAMLDTLQANKWCTCSVRTAIRPDVATAARGAQMIKWKQAGMHMESFGMDLTNPDFVAHAESMGARGHRLKSVRSLLGRHKAVTAGCMQAKRT